MATIVSLGPPPPRREPEAHDRGHRYAAEKPGAKPAARFEDRKEQRRPDPGKGRRYASKHSKRSRLKNILEEIFDFD